MEPSTDRPREDRPGEDRTVELTAKATRLAERGHPWFFADDLLPAPVGWHGQLVRVRGARGHDLGLGCYSAVSKLRLRRCGPWAGPAVPDAGTFFAARLATALAQRPDAARPRAGVRLVHGEADALPGLVVDRYADCIVLQSTSAAVEANLSVIVPWLRERLGAVSILARNDLPVREREGLPREVRLLDGRRVEEVEIEERGIRHPVALFAGQKTGFFLDQRLARQRVSELARGGRVLDLFCYQGGFAFAAAAGGAERVVAVDQSGPALDRLRAAAAKNGLAGIEPVQANVFDYLRELRTAGETFDLVVLDPPAFARTKRERDGATRGYRDLNRQALRLLAPGGYLLTCSCSHHVTLPLFEAMLRQAAASLPFPAMLRDRIPAAPDHPVWINLPESEYLKVCLVQRPVLAGAEPPPQENR